MNETAIQELRDLIVALLRSAPEGMLVSDLWRGLQNRNIELGFNEFEDLLMDQRDLIQTTSGGKIMLKPGVDISRVRRTRVVPDQYEDATNVDSTSRLHNLIRYYIDCLREEGKAIAAYRESQNSSFVALDQELYSNGKNFASVRTSAAPGFIKNASGGKCAAFYGYPLLLEWVDTGDGEFADYKITPIFIARLDIQEEPERCIFHLAPNAWRLNPLLMKRVKWNDRSFVRAKLDAGPEEYGDFKELLKMLPAVFQEMDVKEELVPESIIRAADLSLIGPGQPGLYNRCGIFLGGANSYIQGLIRDLEQLKEKAGGHFEQTALMPLLRSVVENDSAPSVTPEAVRVLSPGENGEILNAPQEAAVKQSFDRTLSVVTGPPGTGKSQVVTAIITSAVLHGKTVLFASRNNKAIEVVQERLKKICPDLHTLIRVGGTYDKECTDLLERMGNLPAHEDKAPFRRQMETIDLHLTELDRLEKNVDEYAALLIEANLAEERFELLKQKFLPGRADAGDLVRGFNLSVLLVVAKRLEWLVQRAKTWPALFTTGALRWQAGSGSKEIDALRLELNKASIKYELNWPKNRTELLKTFEMLLPLIDLIKASTDMAAASSELGKADQLNTVYEKIADHKRTIAQKVPLLLMAKVKENASGRELSEETQEAILQYRETIPKLKGSRLNDEQRRIRLESLGRVFPDMLKRLPAWAVTNLSISHRIPLEPAIFDLVIIDEASQCDIPSCLPLLYRAKQAVIIGDPLQLPQITQISQNAEDQLLRQYNLSGLENDHLRYSEKSIYDAARRVTPRSGYQFLSSHYRCHPDIINFANSAHWYDDRLNVFTDVKKLKRPDFWKRGIEWVQVDSQMTPDSPKGYYLREEVNRVVDLVQELLETRQYQGTVGVVCPLRGMADLIRDGVDRRVHHKLIQAAEFESQTAHGFQGDERDVIIYAMAVHPDMPRGPRWFVAENRNLFNVALSRARAAFVVVGDKEAARNFTFENRPVEYLQDFVRYVESFRAEEKKPEGEPVFKPEQIWEERFYLKALKPAGIPVVSQYALGPYKLDFALLRKGKDRKLNIEVDGEAFHKDSAGRRLRRDIDRNIYVKAQDGGKWDVMRFWVYELTEDMESCLKQVQQWMSSTP